MLEVNVKTTNRFAFLQDDDDEELEDEQVTVEKKVVSKRAAKDKRALIVEKKVESKMVSSNVQPAKSVHFSDAASVKEGPRQDNKAGRNDQQRQGTPKNNERARQAPPVAGQNQNIQADSFDVVASECMDKNADSIKVEVEETVQVLEQPVRMLSLEEFKAMNKVEKPQFDIRKPGEGADKKLYQKLVPIKKPKATLKPEQENVEKERTHKRREKALDIPVIFITQKRGGFSGNRGRENNRFRNEGNRRGPNREGGDTEGGDAANFEGSRGGSLRSGGAPRRGGGNFRGGGRSGGDGREQGSISQNESFSKASSSRGGRSFRGGHSQQPAAPPPAPVAANDAAEGVMDW